jgi:ketosteroid isomerase-like protein
MTPDEAAITTVVESIAILADSGNFESLEKKFADRIYLDYTSAFGGQIETKTPSELMTTWSELLPGFERTHHAISNVSVHLDGTDASATADVTADHWVDGQHWQVGGSYNYQLAKFGNDWKVSKMTFKLKNETGSRDVLKVAAQIATAHPVSYLQRLQTQQTIRTFLTSLEEKDMTKFASVWADDAVQDMPYSPEGFPKRVEGKANLVKHYADWPANSGRANFTSELVFYPTSDPQTVLVEYHGNCEIKTTGRNYDQHYCGLFRVVDGKIKLFREYFDPTVFSAAFGLSN